MSYILKFDNREKDLIKILNERGYDIELENLDIGDIQIIDFETKNIIILIERKTYSDLSASIKDGRYKEQKERMIHGLKSSVRKIVLLEGNNMKDFSLPSSTFNSVIINTLLRDNIHIHLTKNKEETIDFIENILLNIIKYYDDIKNEVVNGISKSFANEHNCSVVKKENVNQEISFRNMLCQIPGISNNIANSIVIIYKNMKQLINQLSKFEDKNKIINILSEIKYGKNNRRIGQKVSEKIYNHLFLDDISNLEINSESETNTKSETKSETKLETKSETETNTKLETKSETKSEINSETKLETKLETKSEIKLETKLETNTKSETKLETKSETKLEINAEINEEIKVKTDKNKKKYFKKSFEKKDNICLFES